MNPGSAYPVVLVLAGHDPTGGAGIQADIESIQAQGVHPVCLLTALTVQDTQAVYQLDPVDTELLAIQAKTLLADIKVSAIKIGLLASTEIISVVAKIIASLPGIPVVLDPVLAAGGGGAEASEELVASMHREILPLTYLLTPNTIESIRLTGLHDVVGQARNLMAAGCQHVLITGTHDESTKDVVNRLFLLNREDAESLTEVVTQWPRLAETFHGSGCTLASAIAANLAKGFMIEDAVTEGQCYTWQSLDRAYAIGRGQMIPHRNPCS